MRETAAYVGGAGCDARRGLAQRWRPLSGTGKLRGFGFWVMQRHDDPAPLGYAGLWYPEDWPEPEVGWSVLKQHQRQGYATEAAEASLGYARALGWQTLISLIHKDNLASKGVAEKLGAHHERDIELRGFPAQIYRHRPLQSAH